MLSSINKLPYSHNSAPSSHQDSLIQSTPVEIGPTLLAQAATLLQPLPHR